MLAFYVVLGLGVCLAFAGSLIFCRMALSDKPYSQEQRIAFLAEMCKCLLVLVVCFALLAALEPLCWYLNIPAN